MEDSIESVIEGLNQKLKEAESKDKWIEFQIKVEALSTRKTYGAEGTGWHMLINLVCKEQKVENIDVSIENLKNYKHVLKLADCAGLNVDTNEKIDKEQKTRWGKLITGLINSVEQKDPLKDLAKIIEGMLVPVATLDFLASIKHGCVAEDDSGALWFNGLDFWKEHLKNYGVTESMFQSVLEFLGWERIGTPPDPELRGGIYWTKKAT